MWWSLVLSHVDKWRASLITSTSLGAQHGVWARAPCWGGGHAVADFPEGVWAGRAGESLRIPWVAFPLGRVVLWSAPVFHSCMGLSFLPPFQHFPVSFFRNIHNKTIVRFLFFCEVSHCIPILNLTQCQYGILPHGKVSEPTRFTLDMLFSVAACCRPPLTPHTHTCSRLHPWGSKLNPGDKRLPWGLSLGKWDKTVKIFCGGGNDPIV